jgi:hypothetical protein
MGLTSCRRITIAKTLARRRRVARAGEASGWALRGSAGPRRALSVRLQGAAGPDGAAAEIKTASLRAASAAIIGRGSR